MTEDAVRIDVIVPCYNAENRVAGALDALLAQDYSNYHVFAIDDGSDDADSGESDDAEQLARDLLTRLGELVRTVDAMEQ